MLLATAAVLLIAVTVLLTLFVRTQDVPTPEPASPVRHLEERKAAIYENLRDLQFEYRVGKLSDADYQQTKVGLQKELAVVLEQIDAVMAGKPAAAKPEAKAAAAKVASALECPHCGAKLPKAMKFCGECGKELA